MSLYHKYRPRRLEDVIGQSAAVKQLTKFLKRNDTPHAILFTGPSGVGKTTLARIMRRKLSCSKIDFQELNIADVRGIDEVRSIQSRISLAPMGGTCRVWLLDEIHRMVNLAQDCLLKMLEDPPSHVYFMLATTDPQKLLPTIRTRCTTIKVNSIADKDLLELISAVLKKEEAELSEEVCAKVVEFSDGSARKALVILDAIYKLDNEEEQLACIEAEVESKEGIDLARALFGGQQWSVVSKILKEITGEPETIRRVVLGYMSAVVLNGGRRQRCELILNAFSDPFFDSMKAGLIRACLEVTK